MFYYVGFMAGDAADIPSAVEFGRRRTVALLALL
jgi:hypothetical protein